jgi:hypothetical protein
VKTRHRVLPGLLLAGLIGAGLLYVAPDRLYPDRDNYTLIEEGLYQGGDVEKPPRRTRAVLNLCEKEDPYQVFAHRWAPIKDAAPGPDLAWLREMVEFVDGQRREGRTTFVHCRNGVSRSGMVVVAYLMFEHDWSPDEALEFVRSRRPETRPNRAFMKLLAEWERELKRQR